MHPASETGETWRSSTHIQRHRCRCVDWRLKGLWSWGYVWGHQTSAAVGTESFKTSFIKKKVDNWIKSVVKLADIAKTQPHAAFSTFTHCLQSQWTFLARAMPNTADLFQPLENAIRVLFLRTCWDEKLVIWSEISSHCLPALEASVSSIPRSNANFHMTILL